MIVNYRMRKIESKRKISYSLSQEIQLKWITFIIYNLTQFIVVDINSLMLRFQVCFFFLSFHIYFFFSCTFFVLLSFLTLFWILIIVLDSYGGYHLGHNYHDNLRPMIDNFSLPEACMNSFFHFSFILSSFFLLHFFFILISIRSYFRYHRIFYGL